MSFVYQSASLQNKHSSLFSQSASGPDWGNDCMLYHSHKRNNFLKKKKNFIVIIILFYFSHVTQLKHAEQTLQVIDLQNTSK